MIAAGISWAGYSLLGRGTKDPTKATAGNFLRTVPFAELKLDGQFVKGCATDANNAAICQTAIDLAHRFGSMAVAEGVESMADLQALVAMGCDFGQGVLVAPPMPRERFLELLRQRMNRPKSVAPVTDVAVSTDGKVVA